MISDVAPFYKWESSQRGINLPVLPQVQHEWGTQVLDTLIMGYNPCLLWWANRRIGIAPPRGNNRDKLGRAQSHTEHGNDFSGFLLK